MLPSTTSLSAIFDILSIGANALSTDRTTDIPSANKICGAPYAISTFSFDAA